MPEIRTRVDFAFGAPDRWRAACQVLARHHGAGHEVVVYCAQAEPLRAFDTLLWGFDPTAFIPHVMADDPRAAQTPILLTPQPLTPEQAGKPQAWLLNLDIACPPMAAQYQRILEIVAADDADTTAARTRWREYKQLGFEVVGHDLASRKRL